MQQLIRYFLVVLINLILSPCISASPVDNGQDPNNVSTIAENPDLENQVNGDYSRLNREESPPLGAIQHAWDEAKEGAGVYRIYYNPNKTIRLVTREFMTTTVVFPSWEKIDEVVVGDQSNYQVLKPKANIVLIRPVGYVGIDSSITMLGESGHVYSFYIRTEGYNSRNISDIKINVHVPAPLFSDGYKSKAQSFDASLAEKNDYLEAVAFDPANLDFNFSMRGDESIAPLRVFSDGVRTWFDYGKKMGKQNLPTIYVVLDKVDTPVNVSREGNRLVAQAIGSFTLKSGDKITCVYPSTGK